MANRRGDTRTGDLLDWEPPPLVETYDAVTIRAASLRAKIAHAISATLCEAEQDRTQIAAAMTGFLGEEVSKNMLDAYASESRDDHTISFVRLLALVEVTGDVRPLTLAAEMAGCVVIPARYMAAVHEAMWAAREEEAHAQRLSSRKAWRGR